MEGVAPPEMTDGGCWCLVWGGAILMFLIAIGTVAKWKMKKK